VNQKKFNRLKNGGNWAMVRRVGTTWTEKGARNAFLMGVKENPPQWMERKQVVG